ncbi:NRDE family protein [Microbacterium resistens]|uniref:NRDE family protein n=1 Tax=Microbacterium resistens TaxID=156977 RepID=A0ABY3RSG8_9MICO|nr:NRDE family protein [Microbacterium resistens]UGS25910.1 NRDE family protein [Microbacterium resistens]
MCTVVIEVDERGSRLLAVRDEDPQREWDALGAWWPEEHPGVIGIRDRRAGGAWLAVDPESRRLAVLLNRADVLDLPEDQALSRGSLTLRSVAGQSPLPGTRLRHHGFNLLEVAPEGARVLSWDGVTLRDTPVPPGVHMIAHDDLDDPTTPRIAHWLPSFRERAAIADGGDPREWAALWIDQLAHTTRLDPEDDRAIIRDNRVHGYPTLSLLFCTAEVTADGVEIHDRALPTPGHWLA